MKTLTNLITLTIILSIPFNLIAQQKCPDGKSFGKKNRKVSELYIGGGAAQYFGDLNAVNMTDRRFTGELQKEQIKGAINIGYRYYLSRFMNIRTNLFYTRLMGSDKFNEVEREFSTTWYRSYRNLTFRTDLLELTALAEWNIIGFEPGDFRRILTPFVFAGGGMLFFDPRAPYSTEYMNSYDANSGSSASKKAELPYDDWVRLQPLGTEGQGLPGYPDKYSLVQPVVIAGIGFKFNVTSALTMTFEVSHHFTFTDYLDDVSTVYPNPQKFYEHYDQEKAHMAANLSVRSGEMDPARTHSYITAQGQQRGNPKRNDSYLVSTLSLGYKFSNQNRPSKVNKRNETEEPEEMLKPRQEEAPGVPDAIKEYKERRRGNGDIGESDKIR